MHSQKCFSAMLLSWLYGWSGDVSVVCSTTRDLNISRNTELFTTQFGTGIHDPKRLKCEFILYNVEPVANISLEMASAHIS